MTSYKHGRRSGRNPAGSFFRETCRAGLVLLAMAGPASNSAKAGEAAKPAAAPPAPEADRYPNFSGAGVHGNPAVWPEYGNWGYAELSGSPSQENASLSAILSSRLAGDVHGLLKINVAGDSHSANAIAQGVLALSLPYTFRAGIGIGVDSHGKASAQAGIASIFARKRFLLRNGIDYDLPTGQVRAASEVRRSFGGLELTGSGSVSVTIKDKELDYAGQALGVQSRYGRHLLSFGAGGVKISEWDRLRLHYRLWVDGKTFVDLHLRGKGGGLFRNPDYAGVGITRAF